MAEEGDGDYVAPEFFKPDARAKEPADLFSLGVTMYECATLSKLPRSGDARHAQNVKLHGRYVPGCDLLMLKLLLLGVPL